MKGDDLAWLGVLLVGLALVGSCGELARRGGRAEACAAVCGEDWKWDDACVCLTEVE